MGILEKIKLERIRKEVERMRDGLGKPVDPKIKDLVIGLRVLGICTTSSCQGHLDRCNPYPSVDILAEDREALFKIVEWYNTWASVNNEVFWVILPRCIIKLRPERSDLPLEELQNSAIDFGVQIQKLERIPEEY